MNAPEQAAEGIMDWVRGKVVDWGQDTIPGDPHAGMIATADAVVVKAQELAAGLRKDRDRE